MKEIAPLLLVLIIASSISAKAKQKPPQTQQIAPKIQSESDAFHYLNKYGYNPCSVQSNSNKKDGSPILCQSSMKTMIELFQKQYQLPVTGKLDQKTAAVMSTPRCGIKDDVFRRAAFKTANPWSKKTFTWQLIDQNLPQFGAARTREEIRQAFEDWAQHAPLTFREVSPNEKADFHIAFVDRSHPDGEFFDERGTTLAYAYLPPVGKLRFNTQHKWITSYDDQGINLRIVATHEIGHALGLEHSSDPSSIMYALYKLMSPKDILPVDDRQGIQALYGIKDARVTKKTPTVDRVWVSTSNGKIPPNAIVGGDENGRRVYVARVSVGENNLVPGKLIEGSSTAEAVLFGVRNSPVYEILTHSNPKRKVKWTKTQGIVLPKGAVLVGQSGKYQRYSGRIHHPSGSVLLGKYIMPDGVFYYQYQGQERSATNGFEVFCIA